ncbi:MAG: four helix bundle protein [Gemmataceae bacterium]
MKTGEATEMQDCPPAVPRMTPELMKQRTKSFALRVLRLVDSLPRSCALDAIGKQVVRSATSVGANYRAALRGRSRKEFLAKLGIVEEEVDETAYWIELLIEMKLFSDDRLTPLLRESQELTAIVVATIRSTQSQQREAVEKVPRPPQEPAFRLQSEIRNLKSEINGSE